MTDRDIEDLFAAARSAPVALPEGLAARVLADADAAQAVPVGVSGQDLGQHGGSGFWARMWALVFGRGFAALGGAGAFGGMAAATLAGFYIGFAQPVDTGRVVSALGFSVEEIDMMPGIEALLEEAP